MLGQEITRNVVDLVFNQTMIVTAIGGVFLCFVLVLSLVRFKERMAGVVAWIVSAIIGSRAGNKNSESVKNLSKDNTKKGTKNTSDDPEFNTNLLTPIDDLIEESIKEEIKSEIKSEVLQSLPKEKKKSKGHLNKQRKESSIKAHKNQNQEQEEDSIGYSFLKLKSPEIGKSEKVLRKKGTVKISTDKSSPGVEGQDDNVGFSFLPVKEKGRRHKSKSALEKSTAGDTFNTIVEHNLKQAKDLSKTSVIDHYKEKETKQTLTKTVSEVGQNISSLGRTQNRIEEHQDLETQNKSEFKESKKVSSTVSYASVVTHSFGEKSIDNTNIQINLENQITEDVNPKLVEELNNLDAQVEANTTYDSPENDDANITKDNIVEEIYNFDDSSTSSSSLEVILESYSDQKDRYCQEVTSQTLPFKERIFTEEHSGEIVQTEYPTDTAELCKELEEEIVLAVELDEGVTTEDISVEQLTDGSHIQNISTIIEQLNDVLQQEEASVIEELENRVSIQEDIPIDQLADSSNIQNISTIIEQLNERLQQEKALVTEELENRASIQEDVSVEELADSSHIENISSIVEQLNEELQQEKASVIEELETRTSIQEGISVEQGLDENILTEDISVVISQLLEEAQQDLPLETEKGEKSLSALEESFVEVQISENISPVTISFLEKLQSETEIQDHRDLAEEETYIEEQLGESIQIKNISVIADQLLDESQQEIILETEEEDPIYGEKCIESNKIENILSNSAQIFEEVQEKIVSEAEEVEGTLTGQKPVEQFFDKSQQKITLDAEGVENTIPTFTDQQLAENIQTDQISAVSTNFLEEVPSETEIQAAEQATQNIQIANTSVVTSQVSVISQQPTTLETEEIKDIPQLQEQISAAKQLTRDIERESNSAATTQFLEELQHHLILETEKENRTQVPEEIQLAENVDTKNILEVGPQSKLESTSEIEQVQDSGELIETESYTSEYCIANFSSTIKDSSTLEIYNTIEDLQHTEQNCNLENLPTERQFERNILLELPKLENFQKLNTPAKHLDNITISTEDKYPTIPLEGESVYSTTYLKYTSEPINQDSFNNNLNHLIEQSSKLIEEEKCVKKIAYTTVKSKFDQALEEISATVNSDQNLNMTTPQQIRVLTLNNQEHQECTVYRIKKDWVIQFRLGPSLFGRRVFLYCNYPVENGGKLSEFNRNQYQLLNWVLDEGCKNADDTAAYTQITTKLAGSFHYYFTFENRENGERHGSGYFLVDPVLRYGNDEELILDCIQCQTVLSKNLGSFSSWEKKLQVAKESGYNMIHFSPIQELGPSNSCYSISEQLKLNPDFKKENDEMPTFKEVEEFISKIRSEWKVTSICDIVLNHTANESEWIKKHPEVTYNCVNCPYMRPAYLLDAALHQFSIDVEKGFYEDKGIPTEINSEEHLNAIRYHFRISVLEPLKLQELYICDVNKLVAEFLNLARTTTPVTPDFKKIPEVLKLIQDPDYKRLSATIDMKLAQRLYNVYWNDTFDEDSRLKKCAEELKSRLDSLCNAVIAKINVYLSAAIENVVSSIRYFRVQTDGPKLKDISAKNPLVYRYFTDYGHPKSLKEHEEIMYSNNGCYLMAHNGWVMNSDPLKNFAAPDSNVYIRRELIAWGDSVKLRFGDKPSDCPFLWEYMRNYVEQTAKIFDGVRLDNCHSTPIPVAEYLLDCARKIKPDLYVVAELFTNSDLTDNIFVNRLGITSLVREAMSAWDSHEEGRLVYRYGGYPVGSFYQPNIRPLVPSIAHALFLDLTHDNPSPVEKRSVFDLLPSTALVNMACCASGSNRGYDELVPHHIHVVDETRQYTEWTDDENLAMENLRYVSVKSGIIAAKRAINNLHFTLGKEGYDQVYVDQIDSDIVAVTRHCPETHQSYILVSFTSFKHPNEDEASYQRGIKPLRVEGVLEEIVLEATLSHVNSNVGKSKFAKWDEFVKDSKWINGLSEYQINLKQHIQINESDVFEKVDSGTPNIIHLNFKNFKPGSIVVIKVSLPEPMRESVKTVRILIKLLTKDAELSEIINRLTLADLNRVIYRCDKEERDEGYGFDAYYIPHLGFTVYAGLQGFMSFLANIRPNNDLGHPMCSNLRDGNWMIEYIWRRLQFDEGTKELGQWIEEHTKCFNHIPRYLVPCYFDAVVTGLYVCLIEQCFKLMSDFVKHGSTFVRGLSLGSVQFAAYIKSSDLPVLSPNLDPPKPPTRRNDLGETIQSCVTLSAGLPHFSVGYMRNWGRDTFISLRGLLILTGRYAEAREHILGYAACLRHGLIPNLLDGGHNPRYNCRDAVWWWLYCIKQYVEEAPNGVNILNDKVSRLFPTDDSPAQAPGFVDQPLYQVMQEALTVHFQGLAFRERNAGRQIDEHMSDRGFNNQIGIHPETGFVFGGNEWNCGTWMDKMGSSDKAGNRGKPATPRDGSAIELIGLSKAVVTWLFNLNQENKYPYSFVQRTHKNGSITKWTFKEWRDKIQSNFEKYFWINVTPNLNEAKSDLIHKRGIYKDCYGATQEWSDFQLRCNFPIAMVAAPELFSPHQAWIALNQAEKYLVGPLGMKTLDPEDWAYKGDYDNSNDSNDPSLACGFNYHQGPEWVWPLGYFLRAKLHFASLNGYLKEALASTKLVLSKHFTELQTSPWRGLPELTNSNGSYCSDSSRTQAWSMACILEVLNDLQKIESAHPTLVN